MYISSTEAIEICKENGLLMLGGRATISKWVKQYGIGVKVDGKLQIDKEKLLIFLKGEEFNGKKKER